MSLKELQKKVDYEQMSPSQSHKQGNKNSAISSCIGCAEHGGGGVEEILNATDTKNFMIIQNNLKNLTIVATSSLSPTIYNKDNI